jgi:replicative DNA helicase
MPRDDASPLFGLSQRLPPSKLQAEQALLGALLTNNKAYDRVADFLLAEHFADPVNARIYQAIVRRVEAGQLADAVVLKAEFEHAGSSRR